MTGEDSAIAAAASSLSMKASFLSIRANSLSEAAATSATSRIRTGHATPTTATVPIISLESFVPREASSTSDSTATERFATSTFTSTSLSTSLIITDGHTITSVTPVLSTGVTTIPVSTTGVLSSTISGSKTNNGGIIAGIVGGVVVLVAIVLVFYRLHIRKKASVKRKMSEFGSDYLPRPQPFLVGSLPRRIATPPTRPPRIFSTALSADPSSNSAVFGSARQSASTVAASAGESTDFHDEKADLTDLGQLTSSHESEVPGNITLHRTSTLFSADSDPPPSYRATAIDFTSVLGDS